MKLDWEESNVNLQPVKLSLQRKNKLPLIKVSSLNNKKKSSNLSFNYFIYFLRVAYSPFYSDDERIFKETTAKP